MYPQIIDRLVNVPLLITEDKLDIITSQVSVHLISSNLAALDRSESSKINTEFEQRNSFGVIKVENSLVAKNGGGSSGSTSYEWVRERTIGFKNDGIKTILFAVSSNGGEAAGCFPLCDLIYSLNKEGIRTIGFTDTYANSGGYAILSACSEVYATDLAAIGSVGAVMSLIDVTKMDANMGISYEILRSKEVKGGYSPHEPISPAIKRDLLDGLKLIDTKFDVSVLKYRKGKVSQETLTKLAGKSISAQEGLAIGLVDQIVTGIDEVFSLIEDSSSNSVILNLEKGVNMSENTPSIESKYIAAQAELTQLKESLNTKITAAVSEERTRCSAILNAGKTYSMDLPMIGKAIEKGYSVEQVEDSFGYIKEAFDNKSSVKTTGDTTKTDVSSIVPIKVEEQETKTYMDQLMECFPDLPKDKGGN